MLNRLLLFLLIAGITSCKESHPKTVPLTEKDKASIDNYARLLVKSFNDYEHKLVRQSWNHKAFKSRVTGLNKTQRSVFDYIFDKKVKDDIGHINVQVINGINLNKGKAILGGIDYQEDFVGLRILL